MSAEPARPRDGEPAPALSLDALDGVFGFRLRRLQGLFVSHWSRWFRARGLAVTPVQGGILLAIRENAGLTQVALARLLQVEAPTLMQALAPLIKSGLVDRVRSPRDGRALELRLSESGAEAAAIVDADMRSHEDDLLAKLTPAERRTFFELLEKALDSARVATS